MRQKYMTDTGHLVEWQVAQSGTGINQQIIIDEKGSGSQVCPDTTCPSEYLYLHVVCIDYLRFSMKGLPSRGNFIAKRHKIGVII
jgi:hypothetical protein